MTKKDAIIAKKDEKLKGKDLDIAKKDKRITSLTVAIKGQKHQLERIIDPIDMTEEEVIEPPNKQARTKKIPPRATS